MEVEILKRRPSSPRRTPPRMIYTFIAERSSDLPVATCSRVMKGVDFRVLSVAGLPPQRA